MFSFLLVLCLVVFVEGEQTIVEGPQESFVFLGQTVVLRCKVSNQKGAVQWMKNGFGLGVDRQLKFFPRYSMIGSASRGEYNLQITNTTVGDDDIYACQINEAASEPSVISNPAKLTVLIRPTPPKLQKTSHFMNAVAGEAVTQSCLSRKGKPPPRLGWALSNDAEGRNISTWLGETRVKFSHLFKTSGVTQESLQAEVEEEIQKDGYGYIVSSNISFVPRPDDDRKYILCLSQHDTFPGKSESDSLKLILQYAPRVNLTLASQQQLREGGSALLACNVDAKPLDNIRISWYKNGNQLLPHTTDTFFLETLKMEDHRTEYTCQASNSIGTSHASLRIDVSFGPRIMSTPQEKEVSEGESVSFRCDAVGNPTPTVLWTRAGDDQIVAKGDTITISNARNWQQGEYICTAIVDGFKHASVSHFLHIRGEIKNYLVFLATITKCVCKIHSRPVLIRAQNEAVLNVACKGSARTQAAIWKRDIYGPPLITVPAELSANLGESIEMSCHISGRPKPLEVHWKRNGEELDYASGKMQVHQIPRSYGVESRLIIRDLREIDMGVYNCTANNGIGHDARTVTLKARGVTDVFASLGTTALVALSAGILALLMLICCCLICRRHSLPEKGARFLGQQLFRYIIRGSP
ncbi:hypothetical protein Y032_0254g284 [Ancylostoma ceylanicum]|uniref:Ig-like domain-containing protein n=1 Tax=Ancylostoma ceylanicum TaxID=53326 RepID=A0A016SBD0_9BILA|nr:hypothetical protein Y032_0254g284 [Ancylostoma ceylanicum]